MECQLLDAPSKKADLERAGTGNSKGKSRVTWDWEGKGTDWHSKQNYWTGSQVLQHFLLEELSTKLLGTNSTTFSRRSTQLPRDLLQPPQHRTMNRAVRTGRTAQQKIKDAMLPLYKCGCSVGGICSRFSNLQQWCTLQGFSASRRMNSTTNLKLFS